MARSSAQQAAIAVSMKKAGKKPKAQDGGYVVAGSKDEKKWAKKHIKDVINDKKKTLNEISPETKFQNNRSARQAIRDQKRSLRKWGMYQPYVNEEEPVYKAKTGVSVKSKTAKPKMKSGGSTPAWTRSEGKNPEGGLNAKGVASYRAANPGSKLKTAVTTKPSKLKPGSKAASRRKSFCSRMSGMKKKLTSAKTANDPNSRINKSLRKWNC